MTTLIAWRNLIHDPIRFIATLVGIVFSVVLIAVQSGMLLGFIETTAGLVRNSSADIWVTSRGTTNVDQATILNERVYYQTARLDGVETVSRHIVRFVGWQKPLGGTQMVIVVGFDPRSGMAGPWNIVEGSAQSLLEPNTVMVDRLYAAKLGVSAIGDTVEIAGRRAIVAGFTKGVRTFTQAPYVFTSYNNALRYTDIQDGDASYMLVKARPDVSLPDLAERIRKVAPDSDVFLSADFAAKTQNYWIFTTGAGSALILGASLGALVGIVIVAQTLYAATMERIGEYATLSAIGASKAYLNAIVIKQALISGGIGFLVAAAIAIAITIAAAGSPAAILLPPVALLMLGVAAISMCVLSSVIAIRKLMTIDPTSVFR
jgi:putative ABC transport system permease protein